MTKECKHCKQSFVKEPSCSMKRWLSSREFCSRVCLYSWRTGNPEYKARLNLEGLAIGHKNARLNGFQKGHVPTTSGETHHAWKGGVSDFNNNLRKIAEYDQWRLRVFERDNFTCQECWVRGGHLQADHTKPFAIIVREYEIDSYEKARSCIELWDIANGRTLCQKCHLKSPTWGIKALDYQPLLA